jgi:hypothetical protein
MNERKKERKRKENHFQESLKVSGSLALCLLCLAGKPAVPEGRLLGTDCPVI